MTTRKPSRKTAQRYELPVVLDVCAARGLHGALGSRRGRALVLDGSQVQRLGGQCLQVLLAAAAAWRQDGVGFRVEAASGGFLDGLGLLGVRPEALVSGDA